MEATLFVPIERIFLLSTYVGPVLLNHCKTQVHERSFLLLFQPAYYVPWTALIFSLKKGKNISSRTEKMDLRSPHSKKPKNTIKLHFHTLSFKSLETSFKEMNKFIQQK